MAKFLTIYFNILESLLHQIKGKRLFLKDFKKTALILKDQNIDYTHLINKVNSFSTLIPSENLSKVAIFSENRFEWVYAFYSVWIKKAVAVPIDFMSSAEDVAFILNDCKPEVVFYSNGTKEVCEKAITQLNHKIEKSDEDSRICAFYSLSYWLFHLLPGLFLFI